MVLLTAGFIFTACAEQSIEGDGFIVYHEDGAGREAKIVADEAGRALPALRQKFGPEPRGTIRIILADTIEKFDRTAGKKMPVWAVGVAVSGRNTIALKSRRLARRGGSNLRKTVRHELTHIVLGSNYMMDFLPRWFNEGVAMVEADEPTFRGDFNLAAAVLLGTFVPLSSLDGEFRTARNDIASVCYGQSRSLVNFIIDQHGEPAVMKLLAHTNTDSAADPFRSVLGLSAAHIYHRWRVSLQKYVYMYSIMSGIGLFWLMAVLVVIAYVRKKIHGRKMLAQWDKEDPFLDDLF
jgi:hypothetical protein